MKETYRKIFVFSLLICSFVNLLPAAVHAQDQLLVDKVEFKGNSALSSGVLRERMTLKGYGWIQDVILGKDESVFDKELLAVDLEHLTRFYQREGYLKASLSVDDLETNESKRKIVITIKVEEGPPVLVRHMSLRVSAPSEQDSLFADSLITRLMPKLKLTTDQRFRDEFAQEDISTISRKLADHGYPYAEVESDLTVDTAANRVDIAWEISTGPKSYFGAVTIEGNRRVSNKLIRKYVAVEPGRTYMQRELEVTQRDLIHLSLFEVATTVADFNRDRADTIPITVKLREAPWLSTKFGVGYGTEDRFRLFTESRILGILGEARILTLFAKHSYLEPYHVRLNLTQPAFLTRHTHLTIGPFIRRQNEPAYSLSRIGLKTSIDHDFSTQASGHFGYTFERIHLDTADVAEIDSSFDGLNEYYNKSSILLGFIYDSSNPDNSPGRGIFSAITFKLSGLDLGSDYHFTRTLVDLRHYQAVLGMVLATRVKAGGINSRDDDEFVPIEDRFFSGGSSSVRGWARAELGPLDEEGTPIGGKSLMELSAELRYPIIGILSGVVFTDAGNVWYEEFHYRINELRYSAGLGIRVATPIGPVRLDVAQPIFDSAKKMQVHLSVGQAF